MNHGNFEVLRKKIRLMLMVWWILCERREFYIERMNEKWAQDKEIDWTNEKLKKVRKEINGMKKATHKNQLIGLWSSYHHRHHHTIIMVVVVAAFVVIIAQFYHTHIKHMRARIYTFVQYSIEFPSSKWSVAKCFFAYHLTQTFTHTNWIQLNKVNERMLCAHKI